MELKFLGRIQHQYHKEASMNIEKKNENLELLKQLEDEEARILQRIKNTQQS